MLTFDFRNGVGIDLEFVDGKAIWISRDNMGIEAASFVGAVIQLPFLLIQYGKCYQPEDEDIIE